MDAALQTTFNKLTPEKWADILQNGFEQHNVSVEAGQMPADYSGFGIAGLFVHGTVPTEALATLFEQLSAEAQTVFSTSHLSCS